MDPYYGKPTGESYDEYGNPIRHGTGTGTEYGTTPLGGTGSHDQYQPPRHGEERADAGHGVTGGLRRSGSSSSSSSSEDDGQGGRRKKGLKEKIKEKLPGQGQRDAQQSHTGATTTPGGGGGEGYVDSSGQYHEKKGMMEKIKEKLPGGHH